MSNRLKFGGGRGGDIMQINIFKGGRGGMYQCVLGPAAYVLDPRFMSQEFIPYSV